MSDVRERLALALDVGGADEAEALARRLAPWFGIAKVGMERAAHLMFTARKVDAVEAERIGLIARYAPDERLDDEVAETDEMYQNAGGKKGSRTTTPTTRRDGVPTAAGAMAPLRRTDRRSPAWSGASRRRSGWT